MLTAKKCTIFCRLGFTFNHFKFIDMKKEIFEFICPVSYLQYIFNAELEGLTDNEINRIEDVLSGYCCFSASEDVFFSYRNDFNNLGEDCVTLTALKND